MVNFSYFFKKENTGQDLYTQQLILIIFLKKKIQGMIYISGDQFQYFFKKENLDQEF